MNIKQKGFTLIELLVVVAIIGILASVVLTSLASARKKGLDGKIKSQVAQVAASAAIFYDTNNGYGTATGVSTSGSTCTAASGTMWADTQSAMASYANTAATWPSGTNLYCYATGQTYVFAAQLQGDTTKGFCSDSNGKTGQVTWSTMTGNLTACPGL